MIKLIQGGYAVSRTKLTVWAVLVMLLATAFLAADCRGGNDRDGGEITQEDQAPSFSAVDLFTGVEYTFPGDFTGKGVYMIFYLHG